MAATRGLSLELITIACLAQTASLAAPSTQPVANVIQGERIEWAPWIDLGNDKRAFRNGAWRFAVHDWDWVWPAKEDEKGVRLVVKFAAWHSRYVDAYVPPFELVAARDRTIYSERTTDRFGELDGYRPLVGKVGIESGEPTQFYLIFRLPERQPVRLLLYGGRKQSAKQDLESATITRLPIIR